MAPSGVVCRRAERHVWRVANEASKLSDEAYVDLGLVAKFLNRLSDYLFVAARLAAHRDENHRDAAYDTTKSSTLRRNAAAKHKAP